MTTRYPLTAFEEYMLLDETVDHPMTFFLRVDLEGDIDVGEFQAAFSQVMSRHPILWSTVVRRFGRRFWSVVPERMPTLAVRLVVDSNRCDLRTHIDLEQEPGIRGQLNLCARSAKLWLQFHHSCSDGIGGIQILNELFHEYRERTSGSGATSLSEPRPFPTRRCAFENLSRLAKTKRLVRDSASIWNLLSRPLVSFRDDQADPPPRQPSTTPSFLEARLPFQAAMMAGLKQQRPLAPTVNDVLLRDVYLALGDWMEQVPRRNRNPWIRISAATNLRNPSSEQLGCHNDVSLVFLDRRSHELRDHLELLSGISAEMAQIKKHKMGCAMLRGLNWSRALPGGMAVVRKLRSAYATAVVSNLGHAFPPHSALGSMTSGKLKVATLGFLVPIRQGTPVSFGVLTHASELTIGMQYDDSVVTGESAEQLLTYVTRYLASSLGIDPRQTCDQELRRAG